MFGVSAVLLLMSALAASAQLVNPDAGQPPIPSQLPTPSSGPTENQSQKQDSNKVTLEADNTRWYADDKVIATGNVKAVYQDYTITGDTMEADLQTNIAVFKGNVKLLTKQAIVNGQDLTLNLKTREWSLGEATSRIDTASVRGAEGGKGAPVFVRSAALKGNPKEVALSTGTLTTCDLDHPHYLFSAKNLEIYLDNKIIAHHVSMVGLDKRLITLRRLVIPIRGMKQSMIPQIGSSAQDGGFLKVAYAYLATEHSQGYLKLDLMQKRGVGIGLDHTLSTKLATTQASLYFLADRQAGGNNVNGYLRHQQKLGSLDLNLTGNYRTNSYLNYPQSTSQDYQAALSHLSSRSNTALTFRTSKSNGFGISTTNTTSLRHSQQFSKELSGTVSMDMRGYLSQGMPAADRELNSDIELRQRADKYDVSLVATKRFDLDNGASGVNSYSNLERLPEIILSTDSYRLGKKSFFGLPSRLQLSAGRYTESQLIGGTQPTPLTGSRFLLQWDLLGQNIDLGSKNELNLTGGLRQAYYSSDQMQYVIKTGAALTTRFSDYLKSRVSYSYQQPQGYSPFRFDYTGKYNYSRAVLEYQEKEKLRWNISTGYNFGQASYPWQDISLRLTAHPKPSYAYSLSTGYDLNQSRWRNLIGQIRLLRGDRLALDLGARYDLQTGQIGLARGRFDLPIGKLWRIEGITSWNGITKQFDYQAFRLTRDLHCWEASIVYSQEPGVLNSSGISLELKIKAFPTQDRFGIGQYGQSIDTSMGEYYY